MKKILCCLMILSIMLCFCGCRSKAAKLAEEQIGSLGEITLDSADAIASAKAAYEALSPKQQAYVTNAYLITVAEMDYQNLIYDQQAKDIEQMIHDLRPVTMDSAEALAHAEEVYNSSDISVKLKVDNLSDMVYAFQLFDFMRTDAIEAKIYAIGKVTLESGPAIEAAQKAYDEAEPKIQDSVYNTLTLLEAQEEFQRLQEEAAAEKEAE